jgi:hypothetical protein
MTKSRERAVVSDEVLEKSRPWKQLAAGLDTAGLKTGEEAIFRSAAERDEFYL